jgi:hypothetical protein
MCWDGRTTEENSIAMSIVSSLLLAAIVVATVGADGAPSLAQWVGLWQVDAVSACTGATLANTTINVSTTDSAVAVGTAADASFALRVTQGDGGELAVAIHAAADATPTTVPLTDFHAVGGVLVLRAEGSAHVWSVAAGNNSMTAVVRCGAVAPLWAGAKRCGDAAAAEQCTAVLRWTRLDVPPQTLWQRFGIMALGTVGVITMHGINGFRRLRAAGKD